jgi:hypothetical protein
MHASHQGQGSTVHPVGGMWARYKHIIQRTHVPIFLVPSHVRLQRSLTHVAMVAGCWPERGTYAYVYMVVPEGGPWECMTRPHRQEGSPPKLHAAPRAGSRTCRDVRASKQNRLVQPFGPDPAASTGFIHSSLSPLLLLGSLRLKSKSSMDVLMNGKGDG